MKNQPMGSFDEIKEIKSPPTRKLDGYQSNLVYSPSIFPRFLQSGKKQINNPLIQTSRIFLEKAQASNNTLEATEWLEVYRKSKGLFLNRSKHEELCDEIIYAKDAKKASQLLDFYKEIQQVEQKKFVNNMTVTFFVSSIAIGTAAVAFEIPIVFGVGAFLLGVPASIIAPDFVSDVSKKWDITGVFSKIPSKGDDTPNTEDKDEDS